MIQSSVKDDINEIIDVHNYSIEKIAGDLGVCFLSVDRWSKGRTAPRSKLVINAIKNYKKTLIQN